MFGSLRNWLSTRLSASRRTGRRPAPRATLRLSLEGLETRVVPAAHPLVAPVAQASVMALGGTATYTGQGFSAAADGSFILNNQPAQASDGGTGQFANWHGNGGAYKAGDGYILWVLPANGATSAKITLPDGTHDMIAVGGTFKFASPYYSYNVLMGDTKLM